MSKKKKQNTTKYAGSAFAVILAALLSYFPISKQLNKQETVNETQKQEVVINQDQQQDNDISLEEAVVSVQNLKIALKRYSSVATILFPTIATGTSPIG